MRKVIASRVLAVFLAGIVVLPFAYSDPTQVTLRQAYKQLKSAKDTQETLKASETLDSYGEQAIPVLIKGTRHRRVDIRLACYDLLLARHLTHPDAIRAALKGLKDSHPRIRFDCADELGAQGVSSAKDALVACTRDLSQDDRTRYAAAKSLAELGEESIIGMLLRGLGSNSFSVRHLSNIGVKALCGKDLLTSA